MNDNEIQPNTLVYRLNEALAKCGFKQQVTPMDSEIDFCLFYLCEEIDALKAEIERLKK